MQKNNFFLIIFLFSLVLFFPSCVREQGPLPKKISKTLCDSLNVKFATDINPIIQMQCVSGGCHEAGGGTSGYDLSDYTNLKPYADQGRIRARVIDGKPTFMPKSGKLPSSDLEKIDCWLKAGAPNN